MKERRPEAAPLSLSPRCLCSGQPRRTDWYIEGAAAEMRRFVCVRLDLVRLRYTSPQKTAGNVAAERDATPEPIFLARISKRGSSTKLSNAQVQWTLEQLEEYDGFEDAVAVTDDNPSL
ncbi:MAG TPA: hypothetical protein VE397_07465, partial [Stellaceae bacterium]|nr:hypothetical protein [Stellaceae bacterium]